MPNPRLIGLLVFVCAAALYFGSTNWIETREYHPLNIAISLARGQTHQEFRVNTEANYQLSIYGWLENSTPLQTAWTIRRNGGVVASDSRNIELGRESFLGSAHLPPGFYTLELNVLSDDGQFDRIHPRLDVNADDHTYNAASDLYDRLVLAALAMAYVGGSVFLFLRRAKPDELCSYTGVAHVPAARVNRFPGSERRILLPNFSIFAAIFIALTMLAMVMIVNRLHLTPKGLWVSLLKPGPHVRSVDRKSPAPIVIRVTTTTNIRGEKERMSLGPYVYYDRDEIIPHFFLNGEEASTEQFKTRLRGLLAIRADRTVYLLGSEDATFQIVTNAIDIARDSYASRIVLLTTSDEPYLQQPQVFDQPPTLPIPDALRHSVSK